MEDGLATALTFLSYTCIILFTVLAVFLGMLIKELIDLAKSYTRLSETIQKEIEPTLEEIKKALEGINSLTTGVNKQITSVKNSFSSAYNLAYNATSKLKKVITSVVGGIFSGIKFLLK